MITIQSHTDGATLAIRAQPGAKKNTILGEYGTALKVAVTAPPEDGRANDAILDVLHDWLGVKRSQLRILSGATNRNKVIQVVGFSAEELTQYVADHLAT
jgi:uncharacterized protein